MLKTVNIPEDCYIHTYKYKLYPNNNQKEYLEKCICITRHIWNWALDLENKQYDLYLAGKSKYGFLDRLELERLFTKYRNSPGNEYLLEVPHITERMALWSLYNAFIRFFKNKAKRPRFKSKKKCETFYFKTRADRMYFSGTKIRIEGLPKDDMIEIKYNTLYNKNTTPHIYNPIISKDILGDYWITFGLVVPKQKYYFKFNHINKINRAIGIDLNVNKRFQLSTGEYYKAPDITKELNRLKRLENHCRKDNEALRKQEKANPDIQLTASNRSQKRRNNKNKYSKHVVNIMENFIQTTTKDIVKKNPDCIIMENLNVTGMLNKKYIGNTLTNIHTNFYRCRFVMEQKCKKYDIQFMLAPRDYPSSQLCSNCGARKQIGSNKIYHCPNCGMKLDRDLNAARNLEYLAYENQVDLSRVV